MDMYRFYRLFRYELYCIEYLEKLRWGDRIECIYCGSENTHFRYNDYIRRPMVTKKQSKNYNCCNCKASFSVTAHTIFHNTNALIQKWFLAIFLILDKRHISATGLHKSINVGGSTGVVMVEKIKYILSKLESKNKECSFDSVLRECLLQKPLKKL